MEILSGKAEYDEKRGGFAIFVPYGNIERLCDRKYHEVQVGFPDGRMISPEQRRKAYALMGEIAAWSGFSPEEAKLALKQQFIMLHLQALQKELFSLSNCDVTTAREFITYLIDFVLQFDVPTKQPLIELCDDVKKYIYSCLIHHKCAVCGAKAELHHVDTVGMGNDRTKINHLGKRCLPLCREHHTKIGQMGDTLFMRVYHLEPYVIDEKIVKEYRLRGGRDV